MCASADSWTKQAPRWFLLHPMQISSGALTTARRRRAVARRGERGSE